MAELASRKKCAKAALIALAKQRFAEQQSASSHQLVAPISPSPPELIEKTLRELADRGRLRDNRLVDLGWATARAERRRRAGATVGASSASDIRPAHWHEGRAALDGADHTLDTEADFFESENIFEDGDVVVAYLFREDARSSGPSSRRRPARDPGLRRPWARGGQMAEVTAGGLFARVCVVEAGSQPGPG